MEEPLSKDYDLGWHNNWWQTLLSPDYKYIPKVIQAPNPNAEDILNKLNLNMPCRDFVTLITAFLDSRTIPTFYLEGEDYKKLGLKLDSLMFKNIDLEEHSTKYPAGVNLDAFSSNVIGYGFNKLKENGISSFLSEFGTNYRTYMRIYFEMIFNADMMDSTKKATKKDLLDGRLLFKEIVSYNFRTGLENSEPKTKYYYLVKYLEPVIPYNTNNQRKRFEFIYGHKGNYYHRCKNGRPYKLHSFIMSMNKLDNPRIVKGDENLTKIWTLQNFNPRYDRDIERYINKQSTKQGQEYAKYLKYSNNYTTINTYFIPDEEIGLKWRTAMADVIKNKFKLMQQDLQVIDVLKLTEEVNYLTKKTELDYFGDVQGLEVKSLNDIDISGFQVKSKPMLYLNWLKSKNPLRGEKE